MILSAKKLAEVKAWHEGKAAYKNGIPTQGNPFSKKDAGLHNSWKAGHVSGQNDARLEKLRGTP